ncbi:MAG: histidine kinase [Dehalococcoidia bacterium]|nr:histidine kinase [Dehalococcoidia bacterium]
MSLAKKIVVLAFAGSAVVVAGFAVLAIWSLQESSQRSLQERLVLATAAAESVDQYNATVLQQLSGIGGAVEEAISRGDMTGAGLELKSGQALPGFPFKTLFIADASGIVLSTMPRSAAGDTATLMKLAGISNVISLKKPFVSGVENSLLDGNRSIIYTVPVVKPDGSISMALSVEMDLRSSQIGAYISAIKLGKTGYAQVVDGNGDLIASTQPEQVFGNVDHGDRFVALIQAQKSVVRTCHNCHAPDSGAVTRRKDVLAFAPLSTASWGVAVRQAEDEALADTMKLRENMFILGVLALAVAFPGTIAIASRAVRPVMALTEASKRMAAGDLETSIPEMGEDEVGILAENLEYMRKSLSDSHQEVERRRKEAESLYDIGLEISSLLDTDRILGSVVGEARTLLSSDVSLLMIIGEQGELYSRALSGDVTEELKNVSLARGQGFAGAVVEKGYPLSSEDYVNDPTFVHDNIIDAVVSGEALRSHLGVPLKIGTQVLGSLTVARRQVRAYTKQESDLLLRLGNQASIAISNANLFEEVRNKEELRGQLLEKAIAAQEEERKRIARELHDEPAQIFSALVMQLEAMANELPASEASVKKRLQRLQGLAGNALETIRKIMADLRPTALDDLGLIPAIRQYAEGKLGDIGVKVNVRVANMGERLPAHMETVIFRVLQEAVNNVYKHAAAKVVSIELRRDGNSVIVSVRDDGKGFDKARAAKPGTADGLGLLGIEERVGLLGGIVSVKSKMGKGTELRIEVPVQEGEIRE